MQVWLESHRVSEVTCERLKSEMILTLSDLRGMNDRNIADLNLVMGEQIRLKLAIRKLHDKEQGRFPTQDASHLQDDTAL